MTLRALLTLSSLLALGCAAGNDPAESGTEIGSGGTAGDTSGPMTTGPDPTSASGTSTGSDPTSADDTTTGSAESSSTSDGTSSTGEDGTSTGACEPGTEGCACDEDADPVCAEGLVCNADDLCEAPACEGKKDEPNDDPFEPFVLMDTEDDESPLDAQSILSHETDVDWFRHHCEEPFVGLTSPELTVNVPEGVQSCVFLDCMIGGNPEFDCPEGTTDANAPLDNMPGCCITGSGSFEIESPNCPGGSNDDTEVYLRFDGGPKGMCSAYDFTYGC